MSTAVWSWRGNGLYFINVKLRRGESGPEPEPESLLSADFTQSWPGFKHTDTLVQWTVTWAGYLLCWWWNSARNTLSHFRYIVLKKQSIQIQFLYDWAHWRRWRRHKSLDLKLLSVFCLIEAPDTHSLDTCQLYNKYTKYNNYISGRKCAVLNTRGTVKALTMSAVELFLRTKCWDVQKSHLNDWWATVSWKYVCENSQHADCCASCGY